MAFLFRHQPIKTIYIIYSILSVLFIRLPLLTLIYLVPAFRPRRSWNLKRSLSVQLYRIAGGIAYNFGLKPTPSDAVLREPSSGVVIIEPVPDLIVGEVQELAERNHVKPVQILGYWYGTKGPSGEVGLEAPPEEKVLYYFHG